MRKLGAVLTLVAGLALLSASPVFANGYQSYRICGGDTFTSCAAVEVSVVGHNVTLRVWNLAQNSGAIHNQAQGSTGIIGAIALYNLPAGLSVDPNSLTVNGAPSGWRLRTLGGVAIAIDGRNGPNQLGQGIASGCESGAPATMLSNPCSANLGNSANWVTFNFQVTGGTFDPRKSDMSLLAFDARTGQSSEYWTGTTPGGLAGTATTVTPEPVTMTLIATGLAGMSGAGVLRRRRKNTEIN